MGDWTNTEISKWTLCVWESWFEHLSELAEEGKSLDEEGKIKSLMKLVVMPKSVQKM